MQSTIHCLLLGRFK